MARIFVSVPLDPSVVAALRALPKPALPAARWVSEAQFHITLKFLGEIAAAQVEAVKDAVRTVAAAWQEPITLTVQGVGAFPHPRQARVIWAGVSGDVDRLHRLQVSVEDALSGLGFPREARDFRPHITLARLRVPAPLPADWAGRHAVPFGTWTVPCVHVMESELRPDGARYTVRLEAPLPTQ